MTKTLTEQWREGTLAEGFYYILNKNGHVKTERTCFYSYTEEQCFCFTVNRDIDEVLAPVPSYDEWKQAKENLEKNGTWYTERSYKELVSKTEQLKQDNKHLKSGIETRDKQLERLQEQLEIATKALEVLETKSDKFDDSWGIQEQLDFIKAKCQETLYYLKEMEGVK